MGCPAYSGNNEHVHATSCLPSCRTTSQSESESQSEPARSRVLTFNLFLPLPLSLPIFVRAQLAAEQMQWRWLRVPLPFPSPPPSGVAKASYIQHMYSFVCLMYRSPARSSTNYQRPTPSADRSSGPWSVPGPVSGSASASAHCV